MRTFLNWARSVRPGDACSSAWSSLGPCLASRASASAAVSPSDSLSRRVATWAPGQRVPERRVGGGGRARVWWAHTGTAFSSPRPVSKAVALASVVSAMFAIASAVKNP